MTTVSQRTFSGGEVTPALYDRVDQVKRAAGLRTCRNWIVLRHGGVANRPGDEFICEVENSAEEVRFVPFIFNAAQTYVLLFGDLTMRVIKNGVLQREATVAIASSTDTNPVVVTTTGAHGYSNGDEVFIEDVVTMTELNGRSFIIANIAATTYELQTKDGVNLDGTGFTAGTGGTGAKVFELVTPYLESELNTGELHHAQSADIITLTHPNHEIRELSRTGDISWSLDIVDIVPLTTHPTAASGSVGAGGTKTVKYKVTAVNSETGEESLPAVGTATTISAATKANPVVITDAGHPYLDDDTILITGVVGMTELNGRRYKIANKTANTYELKTGGNNVDSTNFTTYVSGGSSFIEDIYIANANVPTLASPNVITWTGVADAVEYNVYKAIENSYGFIGIADRETFNDSSLAGDEDITDTPPADRNPFLFTGNFPSTVTFHQQRRILANTDNNIEDVFASSSGDFFNFTKRTPIKDSDTVNWNLAGGQVNEVQSMINLNGTLVIMTTGAEVSIGGNASGVLTATGGINPKEYSTNGSSKLQPLLVNGSAIYLEGRQSIIRDLGAEAEFEKFSGSDLTTFSTHLFEDFTIKDMAFQNIPHSVAWFVRSDGTLLGLTRLKEQEILAWHRHDFENGTVENVVSVPEGTEDAVYIVVKREIKVQGTVKTVRYVERFKSRKVVDVEDYVFLDSSVTVDGTNTTATTMTLTTATDFTVGEDLTLTSSIAHFTSADIGNKEIHITDSLGDVLRCNIIAFTSTTIVTVRGHKDVPTTMQATDLTTWGDAVAVIGNLWHLEAQDVGIFADGFVVASPHNPSNDIVTVANGTAIIPKKYVVIHVGLPITADLETLDVDTAEGETLAGKKSNTNRIILGVQDTRGLWVGTEFPPTDDVDFDILSEFQIRSEESSEDPVRLVTDQIVTNVTSTWTQGGRGTIRQVDPVPATVTAIHGQGFYAFRG